MAATDINQPSSALQRSVLLRWRALGQPLVLIERQWRFEALPLATVFVLCLTLYWLTTPRLVALEDDGLFLMNLEYFGIAHSPGYPLFTLLGGGLYHLLPDAWSPALRGHLVSACAGALACMAVYAVVIQLVRPRNCAFVAALAYGGSKAFWSQAIITEVYTLNAAIFFTLLALCIRYAATPAVTPPSLRLHALIALLFGLGLANHWPLLGLAAVGLLVLVANQWRVIMQRALISLGCFVFGLVPYVWLVVRSWTDVPVNFLGKIDSWPEIWFFLGRKVYHAADHDASASWEDRVKFIDFFMRELGQQMTWAGIVIALFGLIMMLRSSTHARLGLGMLVSWLLSSIALILLRDVRAGPLNLHIFSVYPLLAYGITAVFCGYGLAAIGESLQRIVRPAVGRHLVTTVGLLLVVMTIASNWQVNNRRDYSWAHEWGMYKLNLPPAQTQLFISGDFDFPVGYLHSVEKVRPDVSVRFNSNLVFSNRLIGPGASAWETKDAFRDFVVSAAPHLTFLSNQQRLDDVRLEVDFAGFWWRVRLPQEEGGSIVDESLHEWLTMHFAPERAMQEWASQWQDEWTRQHATQIVAKVVNEIAMRVDTGELQADHWQPLIEQASRKNPLVYLLRSQALLQDERLSADTARAVFATLTGLEAIDDRIGFSYKNLAQLHELKAQILLSYPELVPEQDAHAVAEHELRVALNYEFSESALAVMADLLRSQQRQAELIRIIKHRFPDVSDAVGAVTIKAIYRQAIDERIAGHLLPPLPFAGTKTR